MDLISKSGLKVYSKFDSERVLDVLPSSPSTNADLYDLLSSICNICSRNYFRVGFLCSQCGWPRLQGINGNNWSCFSPK